MTTPHLINVLLVESDLDDTQMIETMLSQVQPNPVVLNSVSSIVLAQHFLQNNTVDLILLDLSLSGSNDLDAIKQIQLITRSIAIIVLICQDDQNFVIKTMQHGAQDYLVKGQSDGHLMLRAIHYAIERKHIEQRLTLLAHFDGLTGLANREYFNLTLARDLQQAKRNDQTLGLMFLDLDHFKDINDSLGHLTGDQLLIDVSARLKECVRDVDFIARLGGDEFTIILEDIQTPKTIMRVADNILSVLSTPFEPLGHKVFISSSIGITLYPDDALNTDDLLKNADVAMYQAKKLGRNNFHFYTSELNAEVMYTMAIKNDLRNAISCNQLSLYYQPKIDVSNNKIVGAEALLRWKHPSRGMISPEIFIPIAEQSGLIIEIGKWVIKEAIKQNKIWHDNHIENFHISINLSVKQFQNGELIDYIAEEFAKSSLNPKTVEFEITESLLIKKGNREQEILQALSDKGFKIAIDDFGTGYSSLSYLKRFTIDVLKIDRSFINELTTNQDDAEIVKAIIAMAHALKLVVVAEGVEKIEQMDLLKDLHCDQIQGYLISKPVPVKEFEKLLNTMLSETADD